MFNKYKFKSKTEKFNTNIPKNMQLRIEQSTAFYKTIIKILTTLLLKIITTVISIEEIFIKRTPITKTSTGEEEYQNEK